MTPTAHLSIEKYIADAVLGVNRHGSNICEGYVAFSRNDRPDQPAGNVCYTKVSYPSFDIYRRTAGYADRKVHDADVAALIFSDDIDQDRAA